MGIINNIKFETGYVSIAVATIPFTKNIINIEKEIVIFLLYSLLLVLDILCNIIIDINKNKIIISNNPNIPVSKKTFNKKL